MSSNKKYFYMRLKDTFFDSPEMKVLESMKNGESYQLFYLKLCLLSLKHDGELRVNDLIPYDINMLSSVTRTSIDTAKTAIEIFLKLGLVVLDSVETIFMTEIQEYIGKSSTEAERIARHRRKIKEIQENGSTKSVQMYENRTPEIEIDTEIDTEIDIKKDIEPKPKKKRYGVHNNVLFTETEYNKLLEEWGEKELARMLGIFSEGLAMKNYVYKSHYLAIRNWRRNEKERDAPKHRIKQDEVEDYEQYFR